LFGRFSGRQLAVNYEPQQPAMHVLRWMQVLSFPVYWMRFISALPPLYNVSVTSGAVGAQ
jgi:hypothetical protein